MLANKINSLSMHCTSELFIVLNLKSQKDVFRKSLIAIFYVKYF